MATTVDTSRFLKPFGAAEGVDFGTVKPQPVTYDSLVGAALPKIEAAADPKARQQEAYQKRVDAANLGKTEPLPPHPTNGEEEAFPTFIANYSKCLPHNKIGEVSIPAYRTYLAALSRGSFEAIEGIPLGGTTKLTDPLSGLAFELEGADSHALAIPPAPRLDSAEWGGEMVEQYWMALTRDVSFDRYATDPTVNAAIADLNRLSDYRGPKVAGKTSAATVFRGNTTGDLDGPFISQFLYQDIYWGTLRLEQKQVIGLDPVNYMTTEAAWLDVQNGVPAAAPGIDATPRFIRNARDMASWVRVDQLYQAYVHACVILLGMPGAPAFPVSPNNPYLASKTQIGFGTFGGPHFLTLVAEAATRALHAVWFEKWFVHRRLRPEESGGRIHFTVTKQASYPLNGEVLGSPVLGKVYDKYKSYLLPMAFPGGSPTHPSYGSGHATVAGACITLLKALFNESFVIPDPKVPNDDGSALVDYKGPALTVKGELNKLASNVAVARDQAGVHYRSDYWQALLLGERVAMHMLKELVPTFAESGVKFQFHRFQDDMLVTIV